MYIGELLDLPIQVKTREHSNIEKIIIKESGESALKLITSFCDINDKRTQILATTTPFNIEKLQKRDVSTIVNLKRINDVRRINKFFEAVNENINRNSIFIGCVETLELREKRLLNKFPGILNRMYYFGDYIFKRVLPKLPVTKQLYFSITDGRNRVISRAETLGRLYSCGFEVLHEQTDGYLMYFVARKTTRPVYDLSPSYGPIFGMTRTGKNGKPIKVFKFRTMYPYSEYLQQYVYEKNKLNNGGKFNNDFRVTAFGKIMRKLWIDELPMLINLFRRDLKLVGVRPISKHYLGLYPDEVARKRHKFRPGLIPPYYADLPDNFDEIVESENRYLDSYEKSGVLTDIRYFSKAFFNIVFRSARSS